MNIYIYLNMIHKFKYIYYYKFILNKMFTYVGLSHIHMGI